jgi:hypothetical protein
MDPDLFLNVPATRNVHFGTVLISLVFRLCVQLAVCLGRERHQREVLHVRNVLTDHIGVSGPGAERHQSSGVQPCGARRRLWWGAHHLLTVPQPVKRLVFRPSASLRDRSIPDEAHEIKPNFHTLDFARPGNPRKTLGAACIIPGSRRWVKPRLRNIITAIAMADGATAVVDPQRTFVPGRKTSTPRRSSCGLCRTFVAPRRVPHQS